jgi:hypothetical protein
MASFMAAESLGVTTDYLMNGNNTEIATARLNDRELLARFQDVEQLKTKETQNKGCSSFNLPLT